MNMQLMSSVGKVLAGLRSLLPDLEALYTDVHAHPELSMQESRTSGLAADRLRAAGYEVTTGVGKTGVVGLLRNGDGPTVMLRADMDALPIEEMTGLPYASKVKAKNREGKTVPVMHACGHDMHMAWLVGATELLAQARNAWRGTLMAVFQPAEETAEGAQAMIDDGLFNRFPKPDVVLGQHVMVGPAGTIGGRAGVHHFRCRQPADPPVRAWRARIDAAGKHRSCCHGCRDGDAPANHRLARTCCCRGRCRHHRRVAGRHQGECDTRRCHHQAERTHLRRRRAQARACRDRTDRQCRGCSFRSSEAAGDTMLDHYPLGVNDADASERVANAFRKYFSAERVRQVEAAAASEDFGSFGTEWGVPSMFWFVGGTDADIYAKAKASGEINKIPVNHSPHFAPVMHPTLETGVETMVVATLAWLST